jgi:hypothetical protein
LSLLQVQGTCFQSSQPANQSSQPADQFSQPTNWSSQPANQFFQPAAPIISTCIYFAIEPAYRHGICNVIINIILDRSVYGYDTMFYPPRAASGPQRM